MSSGSILQPFVERHRPQNAGESIIDQLEEIDDLGCFGWLRGVRERAVALELRKKTGNIVAISYGWIERFEFDPSEGITLHARGQKVRIKGRHLNSEVQPTKKLFEGIVRHRVPWVQEASRAMAMGVASELVLVEVIEW